MGVTVNVNMRTVVHASSSGMAIGFPDVCQMSTPAGPIPIPLPNIAQSSDTASGSSTVKCDGNPVMIDGANFSTSTGDEAGSIGGIMSGKTKGKAEPILYSFDVKFDGKGVMRMLDLMTLNDKNTPPMPELQGPDPSVIVPDPEAQPNKLESIELKK